MRFSRFLLPLLALALVAAASKPKLTIRFHLEASPTSGPAFTTTAKLPDDRGICISKVADIGEGDVAAIYPFPTADGTLGCALRLTMHGQIALDVLSGESHGSTLVGFVNGRPVTAMVIDRRVSDGIITIPRGLTPAEVELMKKNFPTLGEKKNKKGSPKAAETPIPAPAPLPVTQPASGAPAPRGD